MARLIDANELKRLIQSGDDLIFDAATERELIYMIDYQPTIEAEPVRHGQWSECFHDRRIFSGICTACGKASIRPLVGKPLEWCPRCGARMDGGDDNG